MSASWGKRDATSLASQLKGRFSTLTAVYNEMNRLANKKKKKGYSKAENTLNIPGHQVFEHGMTAETSSSVAVESHSDNSLGRDRYGNYIRRLK